VGSITVDAELLEKAGIQEYQRVEIVDVDNGQRFATYTIAGDPGSGIICLNGAAARCACVGDKVIIMAYCQMTPEEAREHRPSVVFLGEGNKIDKITDYEKHGVIA
jgi:aspartate 1-decarboxylase